MPKPQRDPDLFLVDVFAERPYSGNQLAVVVGAPAALWPSERMQAFAREMNFSETTFALPTPDGGAYDVRIFTPAEELPFAGHPTLGTAWVLRHHYDGAASGLSLRLGVGVVPVEFEEDDGRELVRMRPRSPELGAVMDNAAMASCLGLDAGAIDTRHPCRRVNIGVEFVIVPLRDLASLRAARPTSLPAGEPGRMLGVLAFAPETYEPGGDVAARVFFEAGGIREDPATGSAAGCLAAWLSAERYFGGATLTARVQQGYEMGRPSCLYIGAEPRGEGFAVNVAGKVQLVARGTVA
ncbi:MAG: PhzF family phenazine biosynthesis protein [Candidatus Binatia bacterium]